jgi:hypothetical protein
MRNRFALVTNDAFANKDRPFNRHASALPNMPISSALRRQDVLLHHPMTVSRWVELIEAAAKIRKCSRSRSRFIAPVVIRRSKLSFTR